MSIYSILEKVRNTPGKNDKIAILTENKDVHFLKEYLFYTYAPHINFYMKKLPKVTAGLDVQMELDAAGSQCVHQLASRRVTGNNAKDFVVDLLRRLSVQDAECLQWMLLKDVKAGINISTINKVWPNCIFEAPYMRCELEDKAKPEDWDWESTAHYIQLKADGMFCNVVRNRNYVKLVTRQGNMFPQGILKALEDDLEKLFNETVMMGELTVYEGDILLPRQTGNGILNSCLQGGELDPKYTVRFEAWDMVSYSDWYKRECKVPYNERFETLELAVTRCNSDLVSVIESHEVGSLVEAKVICAKWMQQGMEGGVLKNAWMPWKDHTSKLQVKIKAAVTVELRARALTPGSGKNADTFGSVTCESECGKVVVDVPGYSDELRKDIHERWESFYKDSVFSVTANALLAPSASNSKYSLFLPRFDIVRLDRSSADTLDRIKSEFNSVLGEGCA